MHARKRPECRVWRAARDMEYNEFGLSESESEDKLLLIFSTRETQFRIGRRRSQQPNIDTNVGHKLAVLLVNGQITVMDINSCP